MKIFTFIVVCAFNYAATAGEPWMYPVSVSSPVSLNEITSQSLYIGYIESHGVRISDSSSRTVHADVASFQDVIKWYSKKIGGTDLPKKLDAYSTRAPDASDVQNGTAFNLNFKENPVTLLTYRFTPAHKQVTFLRHVDNGDVVAVSLLGIKGETSIQVVRRHPESPEQKHEIHRRSP
jgi:hypothetical protein